MDQKLKQRLTGAIILVSLAVIFIPVILEGPDNDWLPRSHSIPEPPQLEYRTPVEVPLPITPPPMFVDATGERPEAAGTDQTLPAEPEQPVAAPSASDKQPVAPGGTLPSRETTIPSGAWVIQVGSFSQQKNALGLRDRLTAAGYAARTQAVAQGSDRVYRVLVGPFERRETAEKTRDGLDQKLQLKGIVTRGSG